MLLLWFATYLCVDTSPHTSRLEFYQLLSPYIVEVGRNSHPSWFMVWSAHVNALVLSVVSAYAYVIHTTAFTSGTHIVRFLLTFPVPLPGIAVFSLTQLSAVGSLHSFCLTAHNSMRLVITARLEEPSRPTVREGMRLRAHPLSLNNCNRFSVNSRRVLRIPCSLNVALGCVGLLHLPPVIFTQGLRKGPQEGTAPTERGSCGQRQLWRRRWGRKRRWLGRGRR